MFGSAPGQPKLGFLLVGVDAPDNRSLHYPITLPTNRKLGFICVTIMHRT